MAEEVGSGKGEGEEDEAQKASEPVKRKRERKPSVETSCESVSKEEKRQKVTSSEGVSEKEKTFPKRNRRRLGLIRSKVSVRSTKKSQKSPSGQVDQETLSQRSEEEFSRNLPNSEPIFGSFANEFHGPCCRDDSHHSDSFLDVIPDPERAERELSQENGNETVNSETSSQAVESDFNLMMTESESGEEEAVLPIKRPREGVGLALGHHGDGIDRHGDFGNRSNTVKGKCSLTLGPPVDVPDGTSEMEKVVQSPPPGVKICPPPLTIIRPLRGPPGVSDLMKTAASYGLSAYQNPAPFYSRPADVHPAR